MFSVIFLLTGFCFIPVSCSWYYSFIRRKMTFDDAKEFCLEKNDGFPTVETINLNNYWWNISKNKTDKLWIGLLARTMPWTGIDGQPAEYFNWLTGEPNGGLNARCATFMYNGKWQDQNCSLQRQSVCSNESHYILTETKMTWIDAAVNCEAKNLTLVYIQNKTMNDEIKNLLSNGAEVWIDLTRFVDWYWDDTEKLTIFQNWQHGQPDNLKGDERCAAMDTKDGTWTDERCDEQYFFICKTTSKSLPGERTTTGGGESSKEETKAVQKKKQTVVKLKIQTTANMEDAEASASLERQLRSMLAKHGVTDFKLTWKKMPKETQNKGKDAP